jgi:hypothetical protein
MLTSWLAAFVLPLALTAQQNPAAKPASLVFTHVTVIDTNGGPSQ